MYFCGDEERICIMGKNRHRQNIPHGSTKLKEHHMAEHAHTDMMLPCKCSRHKLHWALTTHVLLTLTPGATVASGNQDTLTKQYMDWKPACRKSLHILQFLDIEKVILHFCDAIPLNLSKWDLTNLSEIPRANHWWRITYIFDNYCWTCIGLDVFCYWFCLLLFKNHYLEELIFKVNDVFKNNNSYCIKFKFCPLEIGFSDVSSIKMEIIIAVGENLFPFYYISPNTLACNAGTIYYLWNAIHLNTTEIVIQIWGLMPILSELDWLGDIYKVGTTSEPHF